MRNVKELFSLDGRVAIITGASRGLGREAAEALGEAGAKLVLGARREQWLQPTLHEFRERGFEAVAQPCDITDPQQAEAIVHTAIESFGRIDILVNNAGISWGPPTRKCHLIAGAR